jgi:hypothetical protein
MDQERAVNKVVRDMVDFGLISDESTEDVRIHLRLLWTAGYDYYRINEFNRNQRKIDYFNKKGDLIETFTSIEEAGRRLKIGRGTVDDILYGKSKGRRNTGNYFKYAK